MAVGQLLPCIEKGTGSVSLSEVIECAAARLENEPEYCARLPEIAEMVMISIHGDNCQW